MLSADDIRKAVDLHTETVDVPEWGGSVLIRVMSGVERDRFEEMHAQLKFKNLRARLVAATVCDEQGNLLFGPADLEWLGTRNACALDRIFEAACALNNVFQKNVEAAAKNSESSHSNGQPTDSPEDLAAPAESC